MVGNSRGLGLVLVGALASLVGVACTSGPPPRETVGRETAADTVQFGTLQNSDPVTIDNKDWYARTIGMDPNTMMSASYTAPVFELHGTGEGPKFVNTDPTATGIDQVEFVFRQATGNVEIIARLTAADPVGQTNAGLMIRANPCAGAGGDCSPNNPANTPAGGYMGALAFENGIVPSACLSASLGELSQIWSTARGIATDGSNTYGRYSPSASRSTLPTWLRLRRIGSDFAVWHRRDTGTPWIPLWGGELQAPHVLIGMFASGLWSPHTNGVARFDNVTVTDLGQPDAQGRFPLSDFPGTTFLSTGFIGATSVADSSGLVTDTMHGFYVDPEGYSYTYGSQVEVSPNLNVFDPSGSVVKLARNTLSTLYNNDYSPAQGGITGDGTSVYLATRAGGSLWIEKHATHTYAFQGMASIASLAGTSVPHNIGGMTAFATALGGRIYVTDTDPDSFNKKKVHVIDAAALTPASPVPVAPDIASCTLTQTPGLIAGDRRGRLWVSLPQATTPEPITGAWTFGSNASTTIQCYEAPTSVSGDCVPCAGVGTLTVDNPSGLALSPNTTAAVMPTGNPGTLLVASNGVPNTSSQPPPNVQNISKFSLSTLSLSGTIGTPNGVFGSANPGMPYPNGSSTTVLPRLFSPIGVGIDTSNNTYVASSAPRIEIDKINSAGVKQWSRFGVGREAGTFDPTSDGNDFFTTTRHFVKAVGGKAGSDWDLKSVTWNPFASYALNDKRIAYSDASATLPFIRWIGGTRYMFLYRTAGAEVGQLRIYKFNGGGEIAQPYGSVRTSGSQVYVWIDTNGDGNENAGEAQPSTPAPGDSFYPTVDANGAIWLSFYPNVNPGLGGIWRLTPAGNPTVWSLASKQAYPTPDVYNSLYNFPALPQYDVATDALYLMSLRDETSTLPPCQGNDCLSTAVTRIAHFTDAQQRSVSYQIPMPDPRRSLAEDEDFGGLPVYPACGTSDWPYQANMPFEMAGDYFFVMSRASAMIYAYHAATGVRAADLFVGPEVSGYFTEDDTPSIRALKRSNGDYLLSWFDVTNVPANHLLTWTPAVTSPADFAPTAWYVASSNDITDAGGGAVSVWSDRSGHGHDASMSDPCCRPAYLGTGWPGSKPTLHFNGTTSVLTQSPWPTESPFGTESAFTVLAVARATEVRDAALISWWGTGGVVGAFTHSSAGSLVMESRRASAFGGDHTFDGTIDLALSPHALAYRYEGGVFSFSVDGTHFTSKNSPPFSAVGPLLGGQNQGQIVIGWEDTWADMKYQGDISELVLVPRALTDAEVDAFCTYAATQWTGMTCQAGP